jgi:PKD repeat protein
MPRIYLTVPASIRANATTPPLLEAAINTPIALSNSDNTGVTTWTWSIVDQPPGPVDALTSTSSATPSITPTKEGTYIVQLIVNQGYGDIESTNRAAIAVRQVKTGRRIPAASEQLEADPTDGWATALNEIARAHESAIYGGALAAAKAGGTLARKSVVALAEATIIKASLPGEELIPVALQASASTASIATDMLGVLEGTLQGTDAVLGNQIIVRTQGIVRGLSLGAVSIGADVYVTNAGAISTTPGTYPRRIGKVIRVTSPTDADVYFYGTPDQPFPTPGARIPLGGYESTDGILRPTARCRIIPSELLIPGRTIALQLEVIGEVSVGTIVGTATLRNLTDAIDVATITFSETTPTAKTAVVATPGSTKIYQMQHSHDGAPTEYFATQSCIKINWS